MFGSSPSLRLAPSSRRVRLCICWQHRSVLIPRVLGLRAGAGVDVRARYTSLPNDSDDQGTQWRSRTEQNENEYSRLRGDEVDEVHLRARHLFDEDKAMTPLGQTQVTTKILTEAQRIAYAMQSILEPSSSIFG